MTKKIKIGERFVGNGEPVFIIAEAGSNHDRKLEQAKRLIDIAAKAGADAIKFQTFSADKLVARLVPGTGDEETPARCAAMYESFKRVELPRRWHRILAEYAEKRGLIFLSSPFDEEAVDLLDEIGVPAFKVASGDLTNLPLIRYMARKGKPMIVSTGVSTLQEVREAVNTIKKTGNKDVILLHCVSMYPTPPENVNLLVMKTLEKKFRLPVGFSDHTLGIEASIAAVALGAVMIEKHFTISRKLRGPDHFFALEPRELMKMVNSIREVEKMRGRGIKEVLEGEKEGRFLGRRSIFAATDIPAGTVLKKEMLTILRPALGLEPKYLHKVIGKRAKKNIKRYEPITWDKIG